MGTFTMRAVSPIFTTIIASSSSSRSDGAKKTTETFLARRVSRSCAASSSFFLFFFFFFFFFQSSTSRKRNPESTTTTPPTEHLCGLQSSSDTANEGIETNDETEEDAPWAKPGYKGAWVSQQDNQTQILVVTAI